MNLDDTRAGDEPGCPAFTPTIVEFKVCGACNLHLSVSSFNKRAASKDGLCHACKSCRQKYKADYLAKNRGLLSQKFKKAYAANPGYWKEKARAYREANAAEYNKKAIESQIRNRDKVYARQRAWTLLKRKTDVQFKLRTNLRRRLHHAMSGRLKSASAVDDLGCTVAFLKEWLESKFSDGMSWANYGPVWHIDHKKPLTAFDLTDREQALKACHYTNLQPLLASDNIRKGGVTKRSPKSQPIASKILP